MTGDRVEIMRKFWLFCYEMRLRDQGVWSTTPVSSDREMALLSSFL
ncbi:hypothetical protein JOE11_001371 [Robbsia andropogonis]